VEDPVDAVLAVRPQVRPRLEPQLRMLASGGSVFLLALGLGLVDLPQTWRLALVCVIALEVGRRSTTPERAERACTSQVLGGALVIVATAVIQLFIFALGARDQQVLLVSAAVLVWALVITGFWKRWRVWQAPDPERHLALLVTTLAALLVSIQAAAVLTANIHGGAESLLTIEGHYAWHLLDSIPALKVPNTLHISDPFTSTSVTCGSVLLAFKVLVVLPVLAAATYLLKGAKGAAQK
jgi:hypothetical protein